MKDIDQLILAHESTVKFSRSQAVFRKSVNKSLEGVVAALDALVRKPGRGRVAQVDAINRASIVLLSAHLQGYVEELHREAATILLSSRVSDVECLIKITSSQFRNPTANAVTSLFNTIGINNIFVAVKWQKARSDSIQRRLTDLIILRNKIAHGDLEYVTKERVVRSRKFIERLAEKLDEVIGVELEQLMKKKPW